MTLETSTETYMQLKPEAVSQVFRPGMSIRSDSGGVKHRIINRGGNISEKEFVASFPLPIDALTDERIPSLTVHARKKSSGNPQVTLVGKAPEDMAIADDRTFYLDDLKYNMSGVAQSLTGRQVAIPVRRKKVYGNESSIVAYAMAPPV